MAEIIVAAAILLGTYCYFCKDKHKEEAPKKEKIEQVEEQKTND